jgi:exopolyphosphatase/pppGpp-phosphohydrolase
MYTKTFFSLLFLFVAITLLIATLVPSCASAQEGESEEEKSVSSSLLFGAKDAFERMWEDSREEREEVRKATQDAMEALQEKRKEMEEECQERYGMSCTENAQEKIQEGLENTAEGLGKIWKRFKEGAQQE